MAPASAHQSEEAAYPLPKAKRAYFLVLLTIIYALAFVDRQIINILAEPIKRDLHLADWQMGAMTGFAFALLYTVLGLPLARLSERGNRSWIISAALVTWSGFTALSAYANNFTHLLMARIGVGIGEAGCVPPAHALITDITPRSKRAGALAVFSSGLPIGTLLGMVLGGVVAEFYGWRSAFLLVGLPGVLLALVFVLTAKDPRAAELRDKMRPAAEILPMRETLALLWATKSFRWMALGGALIAFAGYGHQSFFGSFYLRNHAPGLDAVAAYFGFQGRLAVLGILLGLILGVSATFGTGSGGSLADRFGKKGPQGYLFVPIWATAISVPFLVGTFLVSSTTLSLGLLIIPSFLKAMWYGPIFACVQSIVPSRSRATAVATFLFVVNAIGIGLGPMSAGLISDVMSKTLGEAEGLRVSMIILSLEVLLAAGCFWMARRTIAQDFRS
ncbi:MAG: MFS transporter [Pseudomonadota bacterium]